MRILILADKESGYYWDHYEKSKLKGIDLIISCGDLNPHYLSFLVTFADCPVLYVKGNHDGKYEQTPPEGCVCIDDKIYIHNGIRILGLGGSMCYTGGPNQYTDREMLFRVTRLWPKLLRHRGFDILVTHAPASGLGDGEDLPHKGFRIFRDLLDRYSPRYFLHGHVHLNYDRGKKRFMTYQKTQVINGFERFIFDYEDEMPSTLPYGKVNE